MSIFENFEKKLQAEPKSIVFTEGTDARILSAASRLLAGKTLKVILLGEPEAVKKAAAEDKFRHHVVPRSSTLTDLSTALDEMVAKMVELRKGKMTDERVPRRAVQGQLLRHHAGQDGQGRLPAGRRYLLHRRHRPSRSAADQDASPASSPSAPASS